MGTTSLIQARPDQRYNPICYICKRSSVIIHKWVQRPIDEWCALAESVHHQSVDAFVRRIRRYEYGILNHCDFPIHTSMLEGVNNKIKVIKRKAYGFHDNRYFSLKVIQAFSSIYD